MSQQKSNDGEAPVSVVICFIIIIATNIVTITIGIIRDADGFWSTLINSIICLIYLMLAIAPAIAIPYIIELLSSWIINDSLKETGFTLNFGRTAKYISLYDIICSIMILVISYYSLHALTGLSIFNTYEILKIGGYV